MSEPYKNAKNRRNYDRQFRPQAVEPEPRKPHRGRGLPAFSSMKRVAFVWLLATLRVAKSFRCLPGVSSRTPQPPATVWQPFGLHNPSGCNHLLHVILRFARLFLLRID